MSAGWWRGGPATSASRARDAAPSDVSRPELTHSRSDARRKRGSLAADLPPRTRPAPIGVWTWLGLAAALALYVGFRALVLARHFDAVCMPNYELGTIGNLSKVILEGRGGAAPASHFDNGGGHVAVGWMAVPFYAVFGSSYLALKLVPFVLGVLTLALVARLLYRHYRPLAAVLFAFLFALAPPTLAKYSLIAKGNHFENLFFQFLAISAFFEAHTREKRARWLFITGIAGGVAVSFYFGSLLTLTLLALVHLLTCGARRSARDLSWTAPGFLLGLTPLLWLDVESGGRGRNFLWTRLWANAEATVGGIGSRLAHFFAVTLPDAGCFENFSGVSGAWAERAFLVCFLCAWCWGVIALARSARRAIARATESESSSAEREDSRFDRWKSLPFLLHLPAMAVFASAFDFPFKPYEAPVEVGQYRYLVPHFAFACVWIAIASAAWIESRSKLARAAGAGLACLALATGLFTLPIASASDSEAGRGPRYDGYWFPYYAHVLLRDLPWDPQRVERELSEFDPIYCRQAYFGVGFLSAWKSDLERQARGEPDALELEGMLARFSPAFSIDLARGAGSYLRIAADRGREGRQRVHAMLAALEHTNDPRVVFVAEGMALDFQFPIANRSEEFLLRGVALRTECTPAARGGLERGLGIACGRLIPRAILSDLVAVHKIERATAPEWRASFAYGMGWGAAEAARGGALAPPFWHLLPPDEVRAAMQGFGAALRHNFGADESRRVFSWSKASFSGENARWVERGLAWPRYPEPYALEDE